MTPTPSRLSEERLREIERAAGEATPGPWERTSDGYNIITSDVWIAWTANNRKTRTPVAEKNAAFIALANPATVAQMARELREARGLLSEAADWLCEHAEARDAWAEGTGRAWCSDCHHYLRSDADATLKDRIRAASSEAPAAREGESRD